MVKPVETRFGFGTHDDLAYGRSGDDGTLYVSGRSALASDDIAAIVTPGKPPAATRELVVGATVSSSLPGTGAQDVYTLCTPEPVAILLDVPDDAGFDLYVRRNQAPTVTEFEFHAVTVAADQQLVLPPARGATYFVMTRSFRGDGAYSLSALPLAA